MDHNIESLKKFYEEEKKKVLDQVSVQELGVCLEERRKEIIKRGRKLNREYKDTKSKLTTNGAIKTMYKKEIRRLETVIQYLIELKEETSTDTLGNACQEALNVFDVEDKIKEEFKTMRKGLEDTKRKMKEMKKEIRKLNEYMKTLNYLKEYGTYEFDDDKLKTFLLLNVKSSLLTSSCCLKSPMDEFKAFSSVEKVFDIKGVMEKELVNVGEGVKMSEPLKVEKRLLTGNNLYVSLSHQGILAICVEGNTIQFTDLNTDRQVEMKVERSSLAGYYDNKILLLTFWENLREATVENVFENPNIRTFKYIYGTQYADSCTDVTLLNVKRVLYYATVDNELFSFNVDTRVNLKVDVGRKVLSIPSFTGVDYGVKTVFKDYDDGCTYAINVDDSVTKIDERQDGCLTTIFPSISSPRNIKNAVLKYWWDLMRNGNKINTNRLIRFDWFYSIIRVYKDIFLSYDNKTMSWVLFRLVVS